MAYSYNFGGGGTNRNAYVYGVGHGVKSEYGGFPVGNINDVGSRPVKIYGISVIGLSGGYPLIWYAGGETGGGGVFNGVGGPFAIRCISNSGTMYFGRLNDNGVNTIDEQDGSVWSPRGGICGWFDWATVPSQTQPLGFQPGSGGSMTYYFSGVSDGGAGVFEWQVQWAWDPSFTTGVGVAQSNGTTTFQGQPGQTYYVRSRGRNDVGYGQWSNVLSATAIGAPSATQSLSATVSTTVASAVNLSWAAPAVPGGAITGYKIYRNSSLIHTTSGTGTSYTDTGLTKNTSYSYFVRARNAYSDSQGTEGASSNTATVTAQGVPGPPLNLNAVPDGVNPGEIDLTWTAPTYTGVGGITGYELYFSTGTLINSAIAAGTTSYSVTGLTPGTTYGFYVRAKNAITAASGTPGENSATAYGSALGDPPQPTGVTLTSSSAVAGRLTLAWTAPALGVSATTGYTVFNADTSTEIARVTSMNYVIDGLTPGLTYSYYVKARNTVTDQAGSDGGPKSVTVSGTPGSTANQATGTLSNVLTDNTNLVFSGTKTVSSISATSFTYTSPGPDIPKVASGGTATNTTNTNLNGTVTIAVPNSTSFTYSKTNANIPQTSTGGTLTNTTNVMFNGTYTVSAADSFLKTVSYAKTNANVTTRAATGQITNNTNTTFNGTNFTITAVTLNTFSYAKTASNVTEISATGTAVDATNRDFYNGTYTVLDVPAYNVFTYRRVG